MPYYVVTQESGEAVLVEAPTKETAFMEVPSAIAVRIAHAGDAERYNLDEPQVKYFRAK
jgi:hypothetical protein